MTLSAKLKDLRVQRGETFKQVADGIGVSAAHVWGVESGKCKNPGFHLVDRLAKYFAVPMSFLSGEEPVDPVAMRFVQDFADDLSKQDWEMLRAIAEVMRNKRPRKEQSTH